MGEDVSIATEMTGWISRMVRGWVSGIVVIGYVFKGRQGLFSCIWARVFQMQVDSVKVCGNGGVSGVVDKVCERACWMDGERVG